METLERHQLESAFFTFDGEDQPVYFGYRKIGLSWNGWERPLFNEEELMKVTKEFEEGNNLEYANEFIKVGDSWFYKSILDKKQTRVLLDCYQYNDERLYEVGLGLCWMGINIVTLDNFRLTKREKGVEWLVDRGEDVTDDISKVLIYDNCSYITEMESGDCNLILENSDYHGSLDQMEKRLWDWYKWEKGLSQEEMEEDLHERARQFMDENNLGRQSLDECKINPDENLAAFQEKFYLLTEFDEVQRTEDDFLNPDENLAAIEHKLDLLKKINFKELSEEEAKSKAELIYIEMGSGFHMAIDSTYIDQVKDFQLVLPTGETFNSKHLS